jgi:hypothetical protein
VNIADEGSSVVPEPTSRRRVVRRPAVVTGRARPRVRRVTRVVRSVDPWSVFKVALVFSLVTYAAVMLAVVLLWNVAHSTGTVDNVERFLESFGWESFTFDGPALFRATWVGGLFLAVGFTGLMVLAATIFNLITDLVGGIHFTVLEEEVAVRTVEEARVDVTEPGAAVESTAVILEDERGGLSPLEAALQPTPHDPTAQLAVTPSTSGSGSMVASSTSDSSTVSTVDADLPTAAIPVVEAPPSSTAKPMPPPAPRS